MSRSRAPVVLFGLTALLGGGCAGASSIPAFPPQHWPTGVGAPPVTTPVTVVLSATERYIESPQFRSDRMSVESAAEALRATQGSTDRIQAAIALGKAAGALAADFDPRSTDPLTAFKMGWVTGTLVAGSADIVQGTTEGDTFLVTAGYRAADEGMAVLASTDEAAN